MVYSSVPTTHIALVPANKKPRRQTLRSDSGAEIEKKPTLGAGVAGAVRRLENAYNALGLPYLFTSFDAASGGNGVNQVQDVFNGLGQLITEYQSHSGLVNTGT